MDPLTRDYAYYSPYHFAGNNPIRNLDLDGQEPLDFSWNWINKMVSKGGKSDFSAISNDPALGQIDVEGVYDKWTKQTWFVTKKQDRSYYWQHDPGADQHQRIVSNKPGGSNGQWVEFERQESRQARLTSELVDNMSMGIFAGAAIGAAAPLASVLPSASAGERALNVGVDYVAQVIGNRVSGKDWKESFTDVNATSLGISFVNPGSSWGKLIANNSLASAFSVSTQSGYNGLGGGKSIETAVMQAGLGVLTGRLMWGVDRAVGKLKL